MANPELNSSELNPDNITREGMDEYLKNIQEDHPEVNQNAELNPEDIKNKISALDKKHKKEKPPIISNVIENGKNN